MQSLPTTRRVACLHEDGRARVIEQALPSMRDTEVLVRVRASLISPGTELSQARTNRSQSRPEPGAGRPFGYQNAGEVLAVGSAVKRITVGARVACMGGAALHADSVVVPQNLCVPMPDAVPFEDAAYSHLAVTALHAVRRGEPALGEYALVVGMGLVGQLSAQLAHLHGAFVCAWDTMPGRLKLASQCGVSAVVNPKTDDVGAATQSFTTGRGFDLAIMAFGGDGTEALKQVRSAMTVTPDGHKEGRIVVVGAMEASCRWASGMSNLTVLSSARTGPGYHDDAWEHAATDYPYPWIRWSTRSNVELVLRLMAEGRLRVAPLTTHRLPLADVDQAVAAHVEMPDRTLGAILTMD